MRKRLSLNDLYNFYFSQGKTCTFSSNDTDGTMVVQIEETMNFSSDYDSTQGLLKTHLQSCHLGENRNKSYISDKSMKQAMKSFKNRPILGYIHKVDHDDGTSSYEFAGHEMELNKDGEIEYLEIPVGIIPESCNATLSYDESKGKTYLEVDGYIFEDYTKAADILREKGECKVSVEIAVNELSYDADKQLLNIDSFTFQGVTILGVDRYNNEEIQEGMQGSNITLADFSADKNSLCYTIDGIKLFEKIDELNNKIDKLSSFQINDYKRKEDTQMEYENVQEEFEEEVTTVIEESAEESAPEVVEEMSEATEDDAPEVVIEESAQEETSEEEFESSVDSDDEFSCDKKKKKCDADADEEDSETFEEDDDDKEDVEDSDDEDKDDEEEFSADETVGHTVEYSMTIGDIVKNYSVSLNDIIYALQTLVNDTYSDTDLDWYSVNVYDDEKIVEMYGWNKAYRQSYKVKKDTYSLVGDRVEIFQRFLTADEIAAIDKMRSSYAAMETELKSYKDAEENAAKDALFSSDEYSSISDHDEFVKLASDHVEFSLNELKEKLDGIQLRAAKEGTLNFAKLNNKPHKTMNFASSFEEDKKKEPYGGIFKKFKK